VHFSNYLISYFKNKGNYVCALLLFINIGVNVSVIFIHEQYVFIQAHDEFCGQYLHAGYRAFSSILLHKSISDNCFVSFGSVPPLQLT
jgi:hypothetical protein